MIDHLILRNQPLRLLLVEARESIQCVVQQVRRVARNRAYGFIVIERRDDAAFMHVLRSARDLGRFVADALQVGDCLDRCHHRTQVICGRLAFHNQMTARVVQRDFKSVHVFVGLDHRDRAFDIASTKTGNRILKLILDQTAHQQDL